MRDGMKALRLGIHALLNGNVSYDGTNVPFVDKKKFVQVPTNRFVYYGNQRWNNITDQDCTWQTANSIELVIVDATASEVSQDIVDDISNSIMELIIGLPGTENLVISGYQLYNVRFESAVVNLVEITPTQTVLQKVITLTANLLQQN